MVSPSLRAKDPADTLGCRTMTVVIITIYLFCNVSPFGTRIPLRAKSGPRFARAQGDNGLFLSFVISKPFSFAV